MNHSILSFDFSENPVRVILQNGAPWFVAADVCRVLDHTNPTMALQGLDGDDLNIAEVIDSLGRKQIANVVNESGLYSLIFTSRKENAKAFKKWVTSEVLPALRKTGHYEMAGVLPAEESEPEEVATMRKIITTATAQIDGLAHGRPSIAKANALSKMFAAIFQADARIRDFAPAVTAGESAEPHARVMAAMQAVVAGMEHDGTFTISSLLPALPRGMHPRAVGRQMETLRNVQLTDPRGRLFTVSKSRTNAGSRYHVRFLIRPVGTEEPVITGAN